MDKASNPPADDSAVIEETADSQFADTSPGLDSAEDSGETPAPLTRPSGIERVILVVMDTTRWDVMRDPEIMPFLSALRTEGIDLENNWGSGNWTRPTVPAVMTGFPGFSLGENNYGDGTGQQIPTGVPTIGERFSAAGWRTRADLCNSLAHDGEATRGFNSLVVENCAAVDATTTALAQFERSAEWLVEEEGPALLWLQLMEPHEPFTRPHTSCAAETAQKTAACPGWTGSIDGNPWWDRGNGEEDAACKAAIVAAYGCDARQMDEDLEEAWDLLESMGLLENTAVFFTADHGEHMLEPHGATSITEPAMEEMLAHHRGMYAQVSRVGAFMWWRGVFPASVTFPTGHADVTPTILDIAEIPIGGDPMEGESVFALAENQEAATLRVVTQFACDDGGAGTGPPTKWAA